MPMPWNGLKPARPCFGQLFRITVVSATYVVVVLDRVGHVAGAQARAHLGQALRRRSRLSRLGSALHHVDSVTILDLVGLNLVVILQNLACKHVSAYRSVTLVEQPVATVQ